MSAEAIWRAVDEWAKSKLKPGELFTKCSKSELVNHVYAVRKVKNGGDAVRKIEQPESSLMSETDPRVFVQFSNYREIEGMFLQTPMS
jgi:hypothetical protein